MDVQLPDSVLGNITQYLTTVTQGDRDTTAAITQEMKHTKRTMGPILVFLEPFLGIAG